MERVKCTPRPNWKEAVEESGVIWHTTAEGVPYWSEDAYYQFSMDQIDEIDDATNECYALLIEVGQYIVDNRLYDLFGVPKEYHDLITETWSREPPALNYGRFDFAYDGIDPPKMLEFNCATPLSLLESSVAQWDWKQTLFPDKEQFNSIHESFVSKWKDIASTLSPETPIYFTMGQEASGEDEVTTAYMADMAKEAGLENIIQIKIDDMGWDGTEFVDLDDRPMEVVYKLYPWEWMLKEEFGKNVLTSNVSWIEPIWTMIWSNKAILPLLYDLFPNHPNILGASFKEPPKTINTYVKKPIHSCEGSNIEIVLDGQCIAKSEGPFGNGEYIYQQLANIPSFDGFYPVIGSWVVNGKSCGMGIREGGLITDNVARFVPHVIA